MSHIQLNYTSLLFWSIFGEINWSQEHSERLFFLTCLKRVISCENLDLFKQLFLFKVVKRYNFNKKCFSPQSEPHTAKLSFSVVLNHFWGNSLKTSLFIQKIGYLRKKLRNNQKVCFSQQVWKGANPEEN